MDIREDINIKEISLINDQDENEDEMTESSLELYKKIKYMNETKLEMDDCVSNFNVFPTILCILILSFIYKDPMLGVACIKLHGCRIKSENVSLLRKTCLIDTKRVQKISLNRQLYLNR